MTSLRRIWTVGLVLMLAAALGASALDGDKDALADGARILPAAALDAVLPSAIAPAASRAAETDLEAVPSTAEMEANVIALMKMIGAVPEKPTGPFYDGWPHEAAGGLEGLDLLAKHEVDGHYLVPLGEDGHARLTLDAHVQQRLDKIMRRYRPAYAAVVVIEVATGKVVGMSGISNRRPESGHLIPLQALAPSASVFKVVTAASLLEHGWDPTQPICYHGGIRRIYESDLVDNPARDHTCVDLGESVARSVNVAIAKMALKGLDPARLVGTAEGFGFNRRVPFELGLEVSPAIIPETGLELARTAAGFQGVRLSTVHGAVLAATVASGGVMRKPALVEEAFRGGERIYSYAPVELGRAISEETARRLTLMMTGTTTYGTARREFAKDPGLRAHGVAGKTGSLRDREAELDYSWFVGFAPAEAPKYAVAAMVGNEPLWHVRALYVAREALDAALDD